MGLDRVRNSSKSCLKPDYDDQGAEKSAESVKVAKSYKLMHARTFLESCESYQNSNQTEIQQKSSRNQAKSNQNQAESKSSRSRNQVKPESSRNPSRKPKPEAEPSLREAEQPSSRKPSQPAEPKPRAEPRQRGQSGDRAQTGSLWGERRAETCLCTLSPP